MKELKIDYERQRLFAGFDGNFCKVNPRILKNGNKALLVYTMLNLKGSDVFNDSYIAKSEDGGVTFSEPKKLTLYQTEQDGIRKVNVPTCMFFHKRTNKFISLGSILYYSDDTGPVRVNGHTKSTPTYQILDFDKADYIDKPKTITLLDQTLCIPFGQPIEYDNGDVLLSFYGGVNGDDKTTVITALYSFDGENLSLIKAGKGLKNDNYQRGYSEPSVAKLNDKYYLTIRTDEMGLFSMSNDGFNFTEPTPWIWDNGEILENYNTQQRWLRFKDGLYLAYTRRGANNDHIFRHRAPIFMARFDEDNLCLIKSTEVILVPELGARLGNFNITDVSKTESWLTTAEWMQTNAPKWWDYTFCEKFGSDNSIWIAKVKVINE